MSVQRTPGVLSEVLAERERQEAKWGEQNHPDGTSHQRFGPTSEAQKMRVDGMAWRGTLTYFEILQEEFWGAAAEDEPAKLRAELVQVAAVAVAWIECIDRRLGVEVSNVGPIPVCVECRSTGVLCDEDLCCSSCGCDLVVCADVHSAEVLLERAEEAAATETYINNIIDGVTLPEAAPEIMLTMEQHYRLSNKAAGDNGDILEDVVRAAGGDIAADDVVASVRGAIRKKGPLANRVVRG